MSAALLWCFMWGCSPDGGESSGRADGTWVWPIERPEPAFDLGESAPLFTLPVLREAGGVTSARDSVRLSDELGSVLVLDFWNSGCIPCIKEHDTVVKVAADLRDRGVHFFGVTLESRSSLTRFVEEHGDFSYPNLHDDGTVQRLFRVPGWPTKVVIDRDGRVAWWRPGGPIPEATLVDVLEDVLAGRRPDARTNAAYPEEPGS